MLFDNALLHVLCVVIVYNLSFISAIFIALNLTNAKPKALLFSGLLILSSFTLAYLITSPIDLLNKKVIAHKQFMILDDKGVCKEVIIPHSGKNYKFKCDVIIQDK